MTRDADILLVGSGGLIGSAIRRMGCGRVSAVTGVPWGSKDAGPYLARAVRDFCSERTKGVIVWAAGAGVIGSDGETLRAELRALQALLDVASAQPTIPIVLASSAGGVHAGSPLPISEVSPPRPLSDYGEHKLELEGLVRSWVSTTGGRAAIVRISTVYGPGQSLDKGQGLVSALCRSAITRQPISVFVPLDTLRDFIFVDDLAGTILAAADRVQLVQRGSVATKILAAQRSISIGGLIRETSRVCPRPPLTVLGSSSLARQHGDAFVFRSTVWPELDRRSLTTLPAGIGATFRSLCALMASSRTHEVVLG